MERIHSLIIAGGIGSRLWPASTPEKPKQFMDFIDSSLFHQTLLRATKLSSDGYILIVTLEKYQPFITEALASFNDAIKKRCVFIGEPAGRNTAPAIAFGIKWLCDAAKTDANISLDDRVLVLAADHYVQNHDVFRHNVNQANVLAKDFLITFGIQPDSPHTGYGYIQAGKKLETGFKVERFTEKPNADLARQFLDAGNYYWNAGIFMFKISLFRQEFAKTAKDLAHDIDKISYHNDKQSPINVNFSEEEKKHYSQLESISIDYALMEKSPLIAVIHSEFDWSDVGGWDSALNYLHNEKQLKTHDSKNIRVYSDLPVSVIGVQDLDIVVKNGYVLVSHKASNHLVKEVTVK